MCYITLLEVKGQHSEICTLGSRNLTQVLRLDYEVFFYMLSLPISHPQTIIRAYITCFSFSDIISTKEGIPVIITGQKIGQLYNQTRHALDKILCDMDLFQFILILVQMLSLQRAPLHLTQTSHHSVLSSQLELHLRI